MSTLVDVILPNGNFGQIPADAVGEAFTQGYKPLTPDQSARFSAIKENKARFGDLGSEILGTAHQFASGVTGSLVDPLTKAVGIDPKMLAALDAQAGKVGEVAKVLGAGVGLAGLTAATGGLGLGAVAGQAVAGGLYGVAEQLGEWTKNPALSGEQAVAHVGLMSILGGATGAAGLGLGKLLEKTAPMLAQRAAAKAAMAEKKAANLTREAINMTPAQAAKLVLKGNEGHEFEKIVARDFLGKDAFETLNKTESIIDASAAKLGEIYRGWSQPIKQKMPGSALEVEVQPITAQWRPAVTDGGRVVEPAALQSLDDALLQIKGNPAARAEHRIASQFMKRIRTPDVPQTAENLWELKKQMRAEMNFASMRNETYAFYKKADKVLTEGIEDIAKAYETVQPGVLKEWKLANKQYHVGSTIRDGVAKAVVKAEKQNMKEATKLFGLQDAFTAAGTGLIFQSPEGALAAAASSLVYRLGAKAFGAESRMTAQKAWAIAAREQAAAMAHESEKRIAKAAVKLVSKTAPASGVAKTTEYPVDDLHVLAANIPALQEPLAREFTGLSIANPHVSNAAMFTAVRGLQSTLEMLPKRQPSGMYAEVPPPSDWEKQKQHDVLQPLFDPYEAIESPNPTKMAVMRQVYPQIYNRLMENLFEQVALGTVDYDKRLMLSVSFGLPLDYFSQSGPMARIQMGYQEKAAAEQEQQAKLPTQTQATNAARQMRSMTETISAL